MNKKQFLQGAVIFLTTLLTFILLIEFFLPAAKPVMTKAKSGNEQSFLYVALGDSLTEGVGDSTKQGGFVPLLAQNLTNETSYQVSFVNYGVSGNTSQQILDRMQGKPEIQNNLKKANLMTLTVGGNDIRKVIMDNLTDLSADLFDEPAEEYSGRLKKIIQLARNGNAHLPIYVLGIYNPFYLNFPELTEMQKVVDKWNAKTKETVEQFDNVYFVPINDLLYKGVDGKEGVTQESGDNTTVINDALYEEDSFHPNNTGYEIMKQAVLEKINATKKNWYSK